MLLPLSTTYTVAKASREAQIHPSLIVFLRLFWPIDFFFSAFQGELKRIQLENTKLYFLSKGRSCLGMY